MEEKNYSETIANAIKAYLNDDGWHYSFDEDKGLFKFGLTLSKGKIKKINYLVDVEDNEYVVYATAPIGADEEDKTMMANMAEFICRANYGLSRGNFELDMRDGEVRFKYFVDCDGVTPTSDMVQHSIHCPAAMFKRYGSGIVDIIFGDTTAKEAVEKCEKATEDEVRSLLSELVEEDSDGDFGAMLARLAERFGFSDDDEFSEPSNTPALIKTDLFGAEGDDE